MDSISIHEGIDYHPGDLQLCLVGVATKACSGSPDFGEELNSRFGWNVWLGHATYISKMKGSRDRRDSSDGRLIAGLTRLQPQRSS